MGPGNGTFFSFVRHHSRLESGSIQGINIYIHGLDAAVSSSRPMGNSEVYITLCMKKTAGEGFEMKEWRLQEVGGGLDSQGCVECAQ